MPCCCHVSANAMAALSATAQIKIQPPAISAKLTALADVCAGLDPERGDIKLALIAPRLPNVTIAVGGPLAQISAVLALGSFSFGDPVKLEAELQVMANSLNSYVAPSLSAALKMDVSAIMKLALVAKLIAQLGAAGLDPLSADFTARATALIHTPQPSVNVTLAAPQVGNLKLLAGLPALVKMAETLNVPLGDPAAGAMLMARFSALAAIRPPTLSLKISAMLKVAAVVNAIATITETLGADAFTPAGQLRISMMHKAVANLAVPIPPVDVNASLPPFEDVILGEQIAGNSFIHASISGLKPPSLPISAFVSASVAMQAALSGAVKAPPLEYCTNCGL